MSVRDALPGDVYADPEGKLWRVTGTYSEPVVIAQEIESDLPMRQMGGISGLMWNGWKRIYRKDESA